MRIKVLVADDESRFRKLISDFLTKEDYEVIQAKDGKEALEIFFAIDDISLVILDLMMPFYSGIEVCKEKN